jgi:hypothetical protein
VFGGAVGTVVAQPPSNAANGTAAQQKRPVITILFNIVCICNSPSTDCQNLVDPRMEGIWLANIVRLGLRAFLKRAYEPASSIYCVSAGGFGHPAACVQGIGGRYVTRPNPGRR